MYVCKTGYMYNIHATMREPHPHCQNWGTTLSCFFCSGLFVIRVSTVSYVVYDTCRALNVVLQVVRSHWRYCLKK